MAEADGTAETHVENSQEVENVADATLTKHKSEPEMKTQGPEGTLQDCHAGKDQEEKSDDEDVVIEEVVEHIVAEDSEDTDKPSDEKAEDESQGKKKGQNNSGKTKTEADDKPRSTRNTEFCMLCYCDTRGNSREDHLASKAHKENEKQKAVGGVLKRRRDVKNSPFLGLKSTAAKIQESVDAVTQPLLGVNYMNEYQHENRKVKLKYVCNLCGVITESKEKAIEHLKNPAHSMEYLKVAFPEIHSDLSKIKNKDEQAKKLAECATKIEEEKGRRPIHVRLFLEDHLVYQKSMYPKHPISIFPVDNKSKAKDLKQYLGLQFLTKYSEARTGGCLYTCDLCEGHWASQAQIVKHLGSNRHRDNYMNRYYKDLVDEFKEKSKGLESEKLKELQQEYVDKVKKQEGQKQAKTKVLLQPFSDVKVPAKTKGTPDRSGGSARPRAFGKPYTHALQAKLQPALDACVEPLIGLMYVTEIQMPHRNSYLCALCNKTCDAQSILHHLTATRHRMAYMANADSAQLLQIQSQRTWQGPKNPIARDIFHTYAQQVERSIGRHRIAVRVEDGLLGEKPGEQPWVHGPRGMQGPGQLHDGYGMVGIGNQMPGHRGQGYGQGRLGGGEGAAMMDGAPNLLPLIKACAEPMIGLHYIVAFFDEVAQDWRYVCELCQLKEPIAALACLNHVSGFKHRCNYLRRHYQGRYEDSPGEMNRADLINWVEQVEMREGRQDIQIRRYYGPNAGGPLPSPRRQDISDVDRLVKNTEALRHLEARIQQAKEYEYSQTGRDPSHHYRDGGRYWDDGMYMRDHQRDPYYGQGAPFYDDHGYSEEEQYRKARYRETQDLARNSRIVHLLEDVLETVQEMQVGSSEYHPPQAQRPCPETAYGTHSHVSIGRGRGARSYHSLGPRPGAQSYIGSGGGYGSGGSSGHYYKQ